VLFKRTLLRYVRHGMSRPSVCCLSVVCDVAPIRGLNISTVFCHRLTDALTVWPSCSGRGLFYRNGLTQCHSVSLPHGSISHSSLRLVAMFNAGGEANDLSMELSYSDTINNDLATARDQIGHSITTANCFKFTTFVSRFRHDAITMYLCIGP